jgi:hypothetical protein
VQSSVIKDGVQILAIFENSLGAILFENDDGLGGTLDENGVHIIRGLSEEGGMELQLLCTIVLSRQALGNKANKSKLSSPSAFLSAIIYRPLDLFEVVGKFVRDCVMYLQDPQG